LTKYLELRIVYSKLRWRQLRSTAVSERIKYIEKTYLI